MQYTGVFPTIQLEIPTFHSIYAQVQLGILALKSTNQPELGSKRPPIWSPLAWPLDLAAAESCVFAFVPKLVTPKDPS